MNDSLRRPFLETYTRKIYCGSGSQKEFCVSVFFPISAVVSCFCFRLVRFLFCNFLFFFPVPQLKVAARFSITPKKNGHLSNSLPCSSLSHFTLFPVSLKTFSGFLLAVTHVLIYLEGTRGTHDKYGRVRNVMDFTRMRRLIPDEDIHSLFLLRRVA